MRPDSTPPTTPPAQPQGASVARPSFPVAILVFVWLLVFLVTTVVTFILPESFSSTARIRVEHDQMDVPGILEQGSTRAYDPYFVQTEFEVIRSEVILGRVIAKLDLNRRWAPLYLGPQGGLLKTQETLRFLRASVVLNTIRNTSIIEIAVYSDNPEEAAQLANAIAESYRDYRFEQRERRMAGSIQALAKAYQQNNEKIRLLRAQMAEHSRSPGAPDTNSVQEPEASLDELQRFGQTLYLKLAAEKTDLTLPATAMVQIVEHAVPGLRPIRPNKPLNLALGLLIGGLVGLFLATLIYVLQVLAYRRRSSAIRTPFPPRFRAVAHAVIALNLGLVLGFLIGNPLSWETIIGAPLVLFLCAGASAYIELANRLPQPQGE